MSPRGAALARCRRSRSAAGADAEEAFALLLAVVADVDAGFDLLRHDTLERGRPASASSAASTASPRVAPRVEPVSAGGRGRLPVCVVSIRSALRRIGFLPRTATLPRRAAWTNPPAIRHGRGAFEGVVDDADARSTVPAGGNRWISKSPIS